MAFEPTSLGLPATAKLCEFFNRTGRCGYMERFGRPCTFAHVTKGANGLLVCANVEDVKKAAASGSGGLGLGLGVTGAASTNTASTGGVGLSAGQPAMIEQRTKGAAATAKQSAAMLFTPEKGDSEAEDEEVFFTYVYAGRALLRVRVRVHRRFATCVHTGRVCTAPRVY